MQNQIPINWQKVKLGEVALLNPSVSIGNGQYPYIPMEDLDWNKKYVTEKEFKEFKGGAKFEEGDVLFARITPCLENGKIGRAKNLTNGKGFGSTEYFVIRGKKGVSDTDYLYYLCRTYRLRQTAINSMVGASGRQRANIDSLQGYELDLPDFPEQQKIASILSAFDDKIEVNNKIAKTLEEMAQAIFKEWFVKRNSSNTGGKFIKDVAKVTSGNRPTKISSKKEDTMTLPVYGANEIMGYTDDSLFDKRIIITGRVGTIGKVFIVNEPSWPSDNVLVIVPKEEKYTYFLYSFLRRINFTSLNRGSSQPLITQGDLEKYPLLAFDEKIVENFHKTVSTFFDKLLILAQENQKLAALRDLLLPKLMKGEIRV